MCHTLSVPHTGCHALALGAHRVGGGPVFVLLPCVVRARYPPSPPPQVLPLYHHYKTPNPIFVLKAKPCHRSEASADSAAEDGDLETKDVDQVCTGKGEGRGGGGGRREQGHEEGVMRGVDGGEGGRREQGHEEGVRRGGGEGVGAG